MSDTNVSASLPSSVVVDGFTVHKLRLSEYAQVFDKLRQIPAMIAQLQGMDKDSLQEIDVASMFEHVPQIVAKALPEVLEILAIATRTPLAELDDKMDLKTAIKCFKAIFQVNDFLGVWEEVQGAFKALPAATKKTILQKTGSK